jgi:hypothetical protein
MKRENEREKERRSILGKQNEREKKDSSAINTRTASEKKKFGQCSRSLMARERI